MQPPVFSRPFSEPLTIDLRDPGPSDTQEPTADAGSGDDRDRTDDPLLAKQVLSQLSYAPNPGSLHQARLNCQSKPEDRPIPVHPDAATSGCHLSLRS